MFLYSQTGAGLLYLETQKPPRSIRILNAEGQEESCPVLKQVQKNNLVQTTLDASALRRWSPDTPVLYTAEVDGESVRFGHMSLHTFQNKAVLLNDAPVFLSGYIRGIVAHDHPNITGGTEYDAAVKNITQAKKYGFNLVRFHSTIPSEAFVQAADEFGMLIHMEIGFAYEQAENGERRVSANNEIWTQTILRYRNHPSVAIFCIGNEMHNSGHFAEVHALYEEGKRLAPNKLIMDNSGWGEFDRSTADIFSQHIAYFFPYKHHADMFQIDAPWKMNGSVSDEPLDLERGTACASAVIHREAVPLRPVISHEAIHYIEIPDYEALNRKFDAFAERVGQDYLDANGIKKPRYMTELPALIRRKHLEADMPDYIAGSHQWRLMAIKVFFERLRLSSLCGFEMLQFSDCLKYENKNGIVDCFDDDKGVDAAWLRSLIGPIALLADLDNEVHYEDKPISVTLYASDFLPQPEVHGTLRVTLDGEALYEAHDIALAGGLQKLAQMQLRSIPTGKARAAQLCASFRYRDSEIKNEWKLWLYPRAVPEYRPRMELQNSALAAWLGQGSSTSDLFVTDALTERVFNELRTEKTVVLFYEYGAARNTWQLPGALERFKPCIWDRGSNLGGVIRSRALQEELASERYFDLNMQPLLEAGSKVNLDHFPCAVDEYVLGIDKPARDRLQGLIRGQKGFIDDDTLRRFTHLFSLRVGGGTLIVCTFRMQEPENPVCANLLRLLIDHPERFVPKADIEEQAFRKWLEETNAAGFKPEDVMNHFWEIDNKLVEDNLFWEEFGIDLADLK